MSEAALNKAVIRILNIVFRAADEAAAPAPELDLKGDHTIAAELAKECAVLLQNRGVLPLKKGSKVVYGRPAKITAASASAAAETARRNSSSSRWSRSAGKPST